MNEKVREIIDTLRRTQGTDRGHLWNLLTALRGPDDQNDDVKYYYTEPIRGIVLGTPGWDKENEYVAEKAKKNIQPHFAEHYRDAVWSACETGLISEDRKLKLMGRLP